MSTQDSSEAIRKLREVITKSYMDEITALRAENKALKAALLKYQGSPA